MSNVLVPNVVSPRRRSAVVIVAALAGVSAGVALGVLALTWVHRPTCDAPVPVSASPAPPTLPPNTEVELTWSFIHSNPIQRVELVVRSARGEERLDFEHHGDMTLRCPADLEEIRRAQPEGIEDDLARITVGGENGYYVRWFAPGYLVVGNWSANVRDPRSEFPRGAFRVPPSDVSSGRIVSTTWIVDSMGGRRRFECPVLAK